MKNGQLLALLAILAVAIILFFVFTQAFHMLSAPNDLSVAGGVVLLCISFLVIVKLSVFAFKKLF